MQVARPAPRRIMFVYLGRRGPMCRYLAELGKAARTIEDLRVTIVASRQNESIESYSDFGEDLLAVDTFTAGHGALSALWRVPGIIRAITRRIRDQKIDLVVTLMPHVWSPLMTGAIKRAGARYVTIVHDATRHPGDPTSLVNAWILRDMRYADRIITLSDSVADCLVASGQAPSDKIERLFLPVLDYGVKADPAPPPAGEPWRLMFLGRIQKYKGLPLLVEAVEILRAQDKRVTLGVFGEGSIEAEQARLVALGAEIENRWLREDEIASALPRYHAIVLSHIEASQSGVAATAHAAGLPVVATPVGGLPEQVRDGLTGTIAPRVDATGLAEAIDRLISNPDTYIRIRDEVIRHRQDRAPKAFVGALLARNPRLPRRPIYRNDRTNGHEAV